MSTESIASLEYDRSEIATSVASIDITDDLSFREAGAWLLTVKAYLDRVAEVFTPIVDAAHKAHKTALAQKAKLEEPALAAERTIKVKMVSYERERTAKRRWAEEAARREAEKAAEEIQLAEAIAAEKAGDRVQAERILAAPPRQVIVMPPAETTSIPKISGITFRDSWTCEVTDLLALVRAVADGKAPLSVLTADMSVLGKLANAQRGLFSLPGVLVVLKSVVAASSNRM